MIYVDLPNINQVHEKMRTKQFCFLEVDCLKCMVVVVGGGGGKPGQFLATLAVKPSQRVR